MISFTYGILKNDTNEHIYKAEIDSQTSRNKKLWLPKGKERERYIRSLELTYIHFYI